MLKSERIGAVLKSWKLTSPEETKSWGREFAEKLTSGDLILVSGELGSGKTTLAQGIGEGLGVTIRITSPTFLKIQSYPARWTFHHLDLYNVGSIQELEELGIYDILEPENGVCLVEWWDRFPNLFSKPYYLVKLIKSGQDRILTCEWMSA